MTKMKMLVSISVALALLVALVPTVALAADEGSTTGSFSMGNSAPTIGTISVGADPMVPQAEWTTITVPVTDLNNLSDVDVVEVTLFFDAGDTDPAAPVAGVVDTVAILTWTRGGSPWTIDQGAGTSWAIDDTGSSAGSDAATTDNWVFNVKVGKIAREAAGGATFDGWDIYAEATDASAGTGDAFKRDVGMSWYGEIFALTGGPVGFPAMSLDDDDIQCTGAVSVTYIANGTYYQKIKTDSGTPGEAWWIGDTPANTVALSEAAPPPGAGEMVLQADDDATIADAVQVLASSYTTFDTGAITAEGGDAEPNNYLWLSLGATGIVADTYSGTIYYQIDNS